MDARPDPQPESVDTASDFSSSEDCEVIHLPTTGALSFDTSATIDAATPDRWEALAAAVMSEATFEEIDAALGYEGLPCEGLGHDNQNDAQIIELDLWRG